MTVVLSALILWALVEFIGWAFVRAVWTAKSWEECQNIQDAGACWAVFKGQMFKFLFGFYPEAQIWRPILAIGLIPLALLPVFVRKQRRFTIWLLLAYPLLLTILIRSGLEQETQHIVSFGGFFSTALFGISSAYIAVGGGIILALVMQFGILPTRWLCIAIVFVLNSIPTIILLFFSSTVILYFLVPSFGPDIYQTVIWTLGIASAAKISVGLRAQMDKTSAQINEAAQALGFTVSGTFWCVVLPAAFKRRIPQIVDELAVLFQNTAVVSILGLFVPLVAVLSIKSTAAWNGIVYEPYLAVALVHWGISFTLTSYARSYRRKLEHEQTHQLDPYYA